jgi:hypothetical protein
MTTICTDGKTMAADSMQVGDYIDPHPLPKLRFCGAGALVGAAGDLENGELFRQWLGIGAPADEKPNVGDHFQALVLRPSGEVIYYGPKLTPIEVGAPAAIGSGSVAAMAALMCGKSPAEAIEIAIELDASSRGPVRVVDLANASR